MVIIVKWMWSSRFVGTNKEEIAATDSAEASIDDDDCKNIIIVVSVDGNQSMVSSPWSQLCFLSTIVIITGLYSHLKLIHKYF